MDDLAFVSAEETAALVRTGDATPREVVEAALRRIEALEPALNAFIEVDGERALAEADGVVPGDAAPFAGVPIAIKGNTPVEGWELNNGSRFLAGQRPGSLRLPRAAAARGRLRRRRDHEPARVRDPADHRAAPHRADPQPVGPRSRRPAGRSGGAAAAVASGMLPIAHGNDGGGSIRIPASCCGLVGLKPSRGRVSRGPDLGDSWLACDGVLTRTVADTALALDVLGGYEVGDANWAPRPIEPYVTSMRRSPGKLRVAVTAHQPVRRRRRRGGRSTACAWPRSCCRRSGTRSSRPRRRGRRTGRRWRSSSASSAPRSRSASTPASCARGASRARTSSSRSRAPSTSGRARRPRWRTSARSRSCRRSPAGWWPSSPTTTCSSRPGLAERPLPIGECNGLGAEPLKDLARSGLFTPYTSLFNVTGQPAISIPVGFGADGLPTNVQIVGKPLCEDTLLQVALQMEAAHPWAHQRPSVA